MSTHNTNSDEARRPVPLLDLKRQYAPLKEEIVEALAKIVDHGWFVLGQEVKDLEANIAAYSQAEHGIACASGSDALLLALMAYDIGPGDEVILPSFTFFATASAVTRLGATPVFADIDPITYNLDPIATASLITPQTKAIIPVHLFGQTVDMHAFLALSEEHGIPIIEDAAQAIGAEWKGRRAGTMGQIGCFSFYPTKNLGGAGDGGLLTTNDKKLADKLSLLRVHGMSPRYYHPIIGINSRLDSFQAAVLNIKLAHLDRWVDMRTENADRYTSLFKNAGLDEKITLPTAGDDVRHVWNQYVVRVPEGRRDELRQFMLDVKIGCEIYYPLGLHEQECFQSIGCKLGDLTETNRAAKEVLALPIFPEMRADEQETVVARIAEFF
jgi:dTDP-4-amino-4,6-dideoxygalactose transaminase